MTQNDKTNAALDKLIDYVLNHYQPGTFATAWTTYAMSNTTEEDLVQDVLRAMTETEADDLEISKHLIDLAYVTHAHRPLTSADHQKLHVFFADMLRDNIQCHLAENEIEPLETAADHLNRDALVEAANEARALND